jgi:hypothetical protein
MHGLELPEDWKRRTRVFVTKAMPRQGVTPLVPREIYEAERRPSRAAGERARQPKILAASSLHTTRAGT